MPKKNLPTLLRAFHGYRQAGADDRQPWDLVLLGDGELRPDLENQIADLNLAGSVHLAGFRQYDALPAYYGLAGALVLASRSDQWGLAVNEAMAVGLPVLVSQPCGCVPELVREGVNGHVFDPDDQAGLTERLTRMAGLDEARREAMGRASREIIADWGLERFTRGLWEAAALARNENSGQLRARWAALRCRLLLSLLPGAG